MVQLLPFQKLADVPEAAQRHQRAIRGLAITSIVLISLIFLLYILTLISTSSMSLYSSKVMVIFGFPLMTTTFLLVLVSNVISLRNMDTWKPTDVCCNLMRSQPACCTKSCGGNKHCCARLSRVYIVASVFTSLLCLLLLWVLIVGCNEPAYYGYSSYNDYDYGSGSYGSGSYGSGSGSYGSGSYGSGSGSYGSGSYGSGSYGSGSGSGYSSYNHYDYYRHSSTASSTAPEAYTAYTSTANPSCGVLSLFEVPAFICLISLVVITARMAYLVVQIENTQPDIELLSPEKMVVVQGLPNSAMTIPNVNVVIAAPRDAAEKKMSTECGSEQND